MNKTKLYPQCCLRGRGALNSLNKLAESSEIFPSSGGVPNAAKTLPLTSPSSRFSATSALRRRRLPLPLPLPSPRSPLYRLRTEVTRTPFGKGVLKTLLVARKSRERGSLITDAVIKHVRDYRMNIQEHSS